MRVDGGPPWPAPPGSCGWHFQPHQAALRAALRDTQREVTLLTENEVQRSFRNMFKNKEVPPEMFDKAEALLEELRAESPLRHRLSVELEEIRKLHSAKA
jgi:hypothetical protein